MPYGGKVLKNFLWKFYFFILVCRVLPYDFFITNKFFLLTKGRTKKPFRMVSNVLPLKSPLPYLPNDSGLAVLKTCLERVRKSCWIFLYFLYCVLYVFVLRNVITPRVSFWTENLRSKFVAEESQMLFIEKHLQKSPELLCRVMPYYLFISIII